MTTIINIHKDFHVHDRYYVMFMTVSSCQSYAHPFK